MIKVYQDVLLYEDQVEDYLTKLARKEALVTVQRLGKNHYFIVTKKRL